MKVCLGIAVTAMLLTPAAAQADGPMPMDGAAQASSIATCIISRLDRHAQFHDAGDSLIVRTMGPRGRFARWTISKAAAAPAVSVTGNMAGIERRVSRECYR